ncbi:MAG TPA: arylsulfatase [Sphingobacteriaceae bacterium]|nr:arylsulfatase [Sphingobacteriaceae bacterium]
MRFCFGALTVFCILFSSYTQAQKKPNIIIILADDMGYSDIGSFGSEIKTPNLDEMAKGGLRITQFYNMSRCCPTRASLLTGLYNHQAGVGNMDDNLGFPAYQGYLNQNCVTIAEALKSGGYRTLMAGKWHVGSKPENWPRKRGFDRYFGLINGASSFFDLKPYRPKQKLIIALDDESYAPGPGFYATDAYTDYAIKFIEENNNQKPFFLYLAYTAPHWPLHALPADIAKYKGKYMKGWDKLRVERYERMLAMGIIKKSTKLSARDKKVPAWDSLTEKQKMEWDDKMAVYAAMVDRMDQNIGRLRNHLKKTGAEKNTVIMFLSDNGASHEGTGGPSFTPQTNLDSKKLSSDPASFTAYEHPWANVSNTPFRNFKHWENEGGISTPFIAYYPGLIKPNTISHKPAHLVDLMATCVDLAGVEYPKTYKGNTITPKEGISLLPLFKSQTWKGHNAIYFEHVGNRAVRKGDWKIVSAYPLKTWELYNIKNDRSELTNLSNKFPLKVNELQELYSKWAHRAGVIPWEQINTSKK